jgi:hypothetical protein
MTSILVDFPVFKQKVQEQFNAMAKEDVLFVTNAGKDELWETYLKSFPKGTNPVFRERTEHDCQCCKQFIRACGNVVSLKNGKMTSIWDIKIEGHYGVVAKAMSKLVKSKPVTNVFYHYQKTLGTDYNYDTINNSRWDHFYFGLPDKFVKRNDDIGTLLSNIRSKRDVFKRGFDTLSVEFTEVILELIEQKSLYRGEEHLNAIETFLNQKNRYDTLSKKEKDYFCWHLANTTIIPIRNTVIGTLLIDLSEGMELDKAVRLFETKVAPTNYKRPTAIVTKSMIENAQKKVQELGIESSLQRRYAVADDLTINNVLFADRSIKKEMNVFEELIEKAPKNIKASLSKVEDVSIETFIKEIVPKADSISILPENTHIPNLMSIIAPVNISSPSILKWNNNFSWSYNGEVTDSIKERVKSAGGNVEGIIRCSLSWYNYDDLDIHVIEPNRNTIYFGAKRSGTSGMLDVDMNANSGNTRQGVENITWINKDRMKEGVYTVLINQFCKRETVDVGFEVEIEYNGEMHSFVYEKALKNKENVQVAKFKFSWKNGIEFIESLPSTKRSKEMWGISTQTFQKVNMIMFSPNHWDDNKVGNKHYFFILENCLNPDKTRGFYNEYLKEDLNQHRKVFEVLGSKIKAEKSDKQLSGLGFSSTTKNSILCKVTGSFTRTIKINF